MVILQSCGYSSAMRFTLSINCWKRSCAGEHPTIDEACAGEAEPPCPLDRGSHPAIDGDCAGEAEPSHPAVDGSSSIVSSAGCAGSRGAISLLFALWASVG